MSVRKILIVQTGQAISSALQLYGDFPLWFQKSMQLDASQVRVIRVDLGEPLPEAETVAAVVITGSAAMVTDQPDWLLETQRWLDSALMIDKPTLGICYGHQLLVDMLGGRVDYNPLGRTIGSMKLHIEQEAVDDALFSVSFEADQSGRHQVLVSHSQVAISLPQSAVKLAQTSTDANHAFRYGNHVWGLQFHPEWDEHITACYINQRSEDLRAEGLKPDLLLQELNGENHCGSVWLQRFAALALQYV